MKAYHVGVVMFALVFIGLGAALVVVTAVRGGGAGYLIGALFVLLGAGRLYLLAQSRSRK